MTQKYKLEKNLEVMRYSGKPFYWVELEKLQKLKQFCERQTDPYIRERAYTALNEYSAIIETYNIQGLKKANDHETAGNCGRQDIRVKGMYGSK